MKFSIDRTLSAAIAIALLVVTLVVFVSLRQSRKVRETSERVTHTNEVLSHIQALRLAVLDNETSARGFVITSDSQFIPAISRSAEQMRYEWNALKLLTADNRQQQVLLDSAKLYIDRREAFSNHMKITRQAKGLDSAARLVLTGEGKSYSERIHQLGHEMQILENGLLERRSAVSDKSISSLNAILYIVLGVSFVLCLLAAQRIREDVKLHRLNEQQFSSLLDAAPDATVVVDEKGVVQIVNQQMEKLFGYDRQEMLGQRVEMFIPEHMKARHEGHRSNFFDHARVRPMGAGIELKAVRKNGELFPVEISLSPIKTPLGLLVSASVRDISDRKKAEQKFRSLLDSAPDATVIVNEEGLIQMINQQTENLFGYSRLELLGKPVEMLIPADLRSRHSQHRNDYGKSPRVRAMGVGLELNAVKKSGARFPVEISLSPIDTEEGMLISASVRDITGRKELENELKKTNAELEAFTYSVSHDLRAPLRGIVGFTAILEEDYTSKLDDEAKRLTGIIKANTLKMGYLIDDLLAFSRMGRKEINKSPVNMKAIVHEIVQETRSQLSEDREVIWDIRPLPPASADLSVIRQVWVNLISNAVKYSGKKPSPMIEIGSYFEDAHTVYYVRDNGVGFDEQYRHKLFRVFQRLHDAEEFEGTGVGLALAEKIVSKHGGKIWAEGKENEGACFYFSLPLS